MYIVNYFQKNRNNSPKEKATGDLLDIDQHILLDRKTKAEKCNYSMDWKNGL